MSWSARSHILPNIDIGSFEPIMTFRTWAMVFFLFCRTLTLHLVSWKKTTHWLELVEESVVLSLFVRLDQEVDAEWMTGEYLSGDHMGEITLYEGFFYLGAGVPRGASATSAPGAVAAPKLGAGLEFKIKVKNL